jgi:dTDP-4-dehydrorhamnose 3,5-epimerase-like enzyme
VGTWRSSSRAAGSARSSCLARIPGITRGNHYHHTKTEKFFVIAGEGLVRFRPVEGDEVIEFA